MPRPWDHLSELDSDDMEDAFRALLLSAWQAREEDQEFVGIDQQFMRIVALAYKIDWRETDDGGFEFRLGREAT